MYRFYTQCCKYMGVLCGVCHVLRQTKNPICNDGPILASIGWPSIEPGFSQHFASSTCFLGLSPWIVCHCRDNVCSLKAGQWIAKQKFRVAALEEVALIEGPEIPSAVTEKTRDIKKALYIRYTRNHFLNNYVQFEAKHLQIYQI